MLRIILILTFFLCALSGSAQYFQFSQYNYTSQRISPTAPASSDYASVGFIYRNQGTGGDIKLNSNMLSASYPLLSRKTGKRWSGIGITLMDDRSGGIYSIKEGALSYAVNVFLTETQTISLGFKGLYQQRKIDLAGLFTGSQYIPDRGFDQSMSNGENIGTLRNDFMTFSSGLSWQQMSKDKIRVGYWSISLFDFNKPDNSFLGEKNELNSTFVAAGGFRAYKRNNMSVFPEALYTRGSANNVLNVGLITRCDVKGNGKETPFYVDVITKYVVERSFVLGLQFHNENFSIGLSYDALVHKNNVANLGAFEVGLELRRLVNPRLRDKIVKKPASANQKTQVIKPASISATTKKPTPPVKKTPTESAKKPAPKQNMATTLQMKKDSVIANAKAGAVSHQPFVLEKVILHFNFEFNSSEMDEASTAYLDELTEALRENEHLKVKLAGHTDNIGNEKFNKKLSLHRANAIKEYLIKKGIKSERVETEGKGLTEPLNENKTEEDRAKNRRVELTILYQE